MPTMAHALTFVFAGASMPALPSHPTLRETLISTLLRWSGYGAPGGFWRIAAILLALANLKNLPFVWHVRLVFTGSFPPRSLVSLSDRADQINSSASWAQ